MKELPEDIQQKIIAYIDGDLPADEAAALEVYLVNTDPGVSETVIGMMADRQSMSVLPKISAPQDLAGRVMEQLERASLLHNVEHDLNRARRRWWQSRPAIAAGVALFIGGFSLIVLHTVYRGTRPGDIAVNPQPEPKVAVNTTPSNTPTIAQPAVPTEIASAGTPHGIMTKDGAGDAEIARRGSAGDGLAMAKPEADVSGLNRAASVAAESSNGNFKTKGGAPAWLVVDTKKTIPDKLREIPQNIDKPVAHGYFEAPTPQVALSSVSAAPEDALDGPPVVVFIEARDKQDAARLEKHLLAYMQEDEAKAPAERKQAAAETEVARRDADSKAGGITLGGSSLSGSAIVDSLTKTGSGSLTITSGNTYTGSTTVDAGKLSLGGTNNYSGSTAISGGTLVINSGTVTGTGTINVTGNTVGNTAVTVTNGNAAVGAGSNLDLNYRADTNTNAIVQGNSGSDALVIDNGKAAAANIITNSLNGNVTTQAGSVIAANGGTIVFNNAKQAASLHAGEPRAAVNFDNNLGQYAANPAYREYAPRNNNNDVPRAQVQQQEYQKAAEKFDDAAFVGSAGQPYRVYLRPEQLNQVANDFRVRSINRGQVTYVIPENAAPSQQTKAPGGASLPGKMIAGKEQIAPPAPVVATPQAKPPAAPASTAAATRIAKGGSSGMGGGRGEMKNEKPGAQQNAGGQQAGADQNYLNEELSAETAEKKSVRDEITGKQADKQLAEPGAQNRPQRLEVIISIQSKGGETGVPAASGPLEGAAASEKNMKEAAEKSAPAAGH